jgi:hypothetical protein
MPPKKYAAAASGAGNAGVRPTRNVLLYNTSLGRVTAVPRTVHIVIGFVQFEYLNI